jgi:hypothetical protein
MNETTLKERTKKLLEINEIVKKLDETIRPAAFLLLQDYVSGSAAPDKEKPHHPVPHIDAGEGREGFFSKFNHAKPSDNVLLVSAYHYSQYGSSPFSVEEIKALADQVGVTIPNKPYMTLTAAQRKGKGLFRSVGKGVFCPTVHGETFFKNTYKVSKGTQQKQESVE